MGQINKLQGTSNFPEPLVNELYETVKKYQRLECMKLISDGTYLNDIEAKDFVDDNWNQWIKDILV